MRNKKRIILLCFLLLLFGAFLYANQTVLVTEHYTLTIDALPSAFEGLRIVQLSDLHGASFGENNENLVEKVAAEKPDIIVLTGDFVCKRRDIGVFASLLPRLTALAPCYYVSGNHEWGARLMDETAELLERYGVCYLRNGYTCYERQGEGLCLCGVEDPNSYAELTPPEAVIAGLREKEGDVPVLLLAHRNDWLEKRNGLDVDAILCGHGHGGIIRLPFIGGVLGGDRKLFPAYTAGLYEGERYTMLVNRGLGNIHGIPRILNFPEIVSVELKKAA